MASTLRVIGAWRSLVAHLLWEQGVVGSNPAAPILQLAPHTPAPPRKTPQTPGFSERYAGLCGAVRCLGDCRFIAVRAETYCKTVASARGPFSRSQRRRMLICRPAESFSVGANGGVVPTIERDARTDRRAAHRTEGFYSDGTPTASRRDGAPAKAHKPVRCAVHGEHDLSAVGRQLHRDRLRDGDIAVGAAAARQRSSIGACGRAGGGFGAGAVGDQARTGCAPARGAAVDRGPAPSRLAARAPRRGAALPDLRGRGVAARRARNRRGS